MKAFLADMRKLNPEDEIEIDTVWKIRWACDDADFGTISLDSNATPESNAALKKIIDACDVAIDAAKAKKNAATSSTSTSSTTDCSGTSNGRK